MVKIDFISDINKKFAAALGYPEVDRYMVRVLWWHLVAFSILVFTNSVLKIANSYPSPFSWRVITPNEALISLIVAAVAVLIPIAVKGKIKNHYAWRALITVAFVAYSYLFVFISGGSIEMHFHFFIIAALLVMYADWRLGWILLVFTVLHHGVLNYIEPGWVYFYGRNDFSVVSHSLPVLVAILITTTTSEIIRGGVVALELSNQGVMSKLQKNKRPSKPLRKKILHRSK